MSSIEASEIGAGVREGVKSEPPEATNRASTPNARRTAPFVLVASLFLVSGATGLLYEVAFSKLLAYVFGATAYAVSTVLAAFMGGLALGAHFGGKHAAKARRPLALYGALEIVVGFVCIVSPIALASLTDSYVALARAFPGSLVMLTVARATFTALVVVVPTVAMGATLPVLSRVVAGDERSDGASAKHLAGLYAINTAGGAFGALAAAYAILPILGVRGTMRAAALANITIGIIAFVRGRAMDASTAPVEASASASEATKAKEAPSDARLLLTLALLSGFLVFAAEVIETHLLALLIGNSAYAFGLMLAVFLVCLAIGASRAPAFAKKHGEGALARGLAIASVALLVTLPLWDQLPWFFAFAGKHVSSWLGREICRAAVAFVILAIPTLWMGTTFPLLLQRIAGRADVAQRVGKLTVFNTAGTILGSLLTGYVLLPLVGSQRGLIAVALLFSAAAILAATKATARQRAVTLIFSTVALALAILLPKWDMARLTSGANVYFGMGPRPDAIEFVREDVHGGVTTVARRGDILTMYTNGKFQGDDGPEMPAQRKFAHFPSLFVDKMDRALVIGLGTGTTLGTIAQYPYANVDVAEISPAIIEASRKYYAKQTFSELDDPRVSLHVNDGRNLLLVETKPYDLIAIELTSVWFAGAASLYSQEFYALLRSRLTDHGVLQQWVQLHHLRRRELATIVRTVRTAFPHVAFFVGGAQGILVASAEPLVASRARLDRLEQDPKIAKTLNGEHLTQLFDELVTSEDDLDRYVADTERQDGGPIVSTDDNLYLEYATPKGNVLSYDASLKATLDDLDRYRTKDVRARHLRP